MTAPPYPQDPAPNAIGYPFSYWQTVLSQYANSDIITTLIGNFSGSVNQNADMDRFYDLIWNVATAEGFGLDIWGRIIGTGRVITVAAFKYFGFNEANASSDYLGWNQAPWYSGQTTTDDYTLSDESFRTLIYAKALSNISDGSIKSINQILLNLFPERGNAYVTDGLDMSMTYTFSFALTDVELAIVSQSGVLPKPVGVSFTIVHP